MQRRRLVVGCGQPWRSHLVPPSSKKVFVLDTNVLLHDPNSILHFQEHDVVLPIVVIEEVDHFKKDQTEIGRNARSVSRLLDKLRATGTLSRGVPLEGGGTLKVDVAAHNLDIGILSADKHKADNQILACARELLHTCKDRVVLVTKDTNLRIKADAIGVQAEDYTTDRVEMDELYTGHKTWEVEPAKVDLLYDGGLPTRSWRLNPTSQPVPHPGGPDQPQPHGPGAVHGRRGPLRPLRRMESYPWGIKPRNREQQFALELLLDPAVQVVTLLGKAGTGKTLLAIAAGLQKVVDDESYDKILVSRPVMPMGRDLGYLPGDISEKLGLTCSPSTTTSNSSWRPTRSSGAAPP